MRTACRISALVLAAVTVAACWRSTPPARPFEVVRTSPALGAEDPPLLLNDSVTVYFSDPVQPLSVTEDSVTLLDEAGRHVPGALHVGANWVTFEPEPPLAADLGDGSFRPGATYRLFVAGSPRSDAVRAADGRLLAMPVTRQVRIADFDERPPGLASLLRPPAAEMPFLVRTYDGPQPLPVDAPRLRLHFTLPVLPGSLSPDALSIRLLRNLAVLRPRGLRLVTSRLDPFPGSTLEVDIGSQPSLADGGNLSLRRGDLLSVELSQGPAALTDYAGAAVLPGPPQMWSVVEGSSIHLAEWPAGEATYLTDDTLLPGFEVRAGVIRPRLREEAGSGRLGVFHPQTDTTLRPGEPFDRGDGQIVSSEGADFPFTAIDVPEGVTVTIDGSAGPVRLLACGSVRIAGTVHLLGEPAVLRVPRFVTPAAVLLEQAVIAVLAAGDIRVTGSVRTLRATPADASPLTLLAAGRMHLHGELPFQTLLAVESPPPGQDGPIVGTRGQASVAPVSFTYGAAANADLWVRGCTPWRQMPPDRDGGRVQLEDLVPGLQVAWQTAPADPVAPAEPDRRLARHSQPQPVLHGDAIGVAPGSFVRFEFVAHVHGEMPLPYVREVCLIER